MPLTRTQKEEVVQRLKDSLGSAQAAVFANFHGLSVSDTHAMRRGLKDRGVHYTVAKKTLLKRALSDINAEGDVPALEGEVAVAFGDDPVAPANGIAEFAKQYKDSLSILGGIFEGRFKGKEEMEEIAAIPPLHDLRGMLVNVIHSPIQGLAVALSEIAKQRS